MLFAQRKRGARRIAKLELDCLSVSVPMASEQRGEGRYLAHDQKHSLWRAISRRCGMSEVGGEGEQQLEDVPTTPIDVNINSSTMTCASGGHFLSG